MGLIVRLAESQYMKRFTSMDKNERDCYLERVRNWQGGDRNLLRPRMEDGTAAFQNVIAAAAAWSDAEVKAFDEGCILLTALTGIAESGWLPDKIYAVSAKRAIRHITKSLDEISRQYDGVTRERGDKETKTAYFGEGAADTSQVRGSKKEVARTQADAFVAAMEKGSTGNAQTRELWVERPGHLDQYIHLLPESTQQKAANIKALFMKLDEARENARMLVDNPHGDAATRAHWMSKATAIDDQIRAIFKEVDEEWKKVVQSGRVVVDDLGNARVVDVPAVEAAGVVTEAKEVAEEKPDGEPSGTVTGLKKRGRKAMTEEEKAAKREKMEAEKAAAKGAERQRKAQLIRKWLIDTRYAKNDEHDKKWLKKYKEMVKLGGEEAVTDKVREAAEFYGLKI